MAEITDPRFLDKRTAEHYMRVGLLDEKTWEKYVKSLPDVSEKGVEVETAIGFEEDRGGAGEGEEDSDTTA
jgi:hypothetical protein